MSVVGSHVPKVVGVVVVEVAPVICFVCVHTTVSPTVTSESIAPPPGDCHCPVETLHVPQPVAENQTPSSVQEVPPSKSSLQQISSSHKLDSPQDCCVSSVETFILPESQQVPSVVCPVTFDAQMSVMGVPDGLA